MNNFFMVLPDSGCEVQSPQTFTGSSQEFSFILDEILEDFNVTFVPEGPSARIHHADAPLSSSKV